MKKLMIGLVALAAVLTATAGEWFDGGIATGWPNAASLSGGAWTNTETAVFADGAVAFTNASASALTFVATESKAPADVEVAINSTIGFTPRATLPAPTAKAGVVSHGGYFYVLAKDAAGDTNIWTKTDIAATATATVNIAFPSATEVAYKIGEFTTNATIASVESVQNVKLSGIGTLSALSATASVAQFTVSYDAMDGKWADGTTVSNIAAYVKGGYTLPDDPTRVNYDFAGWYVSWTNGAAKIKKSGDPLQVFADHKIYAKWLSKSVDPSEEEKKLQGDVIDGGKAVMLTGGKTNMEGKISSPVSSDFAIPDRVGSGADAKYVTVIASEAYRKDKYDDKVGAANKLTSVQLPSFLTRIGSEAFYACTNVTNVVFAVAKDYTTNEKTVLSVGSRAFAGIAAETVVFPAGSKTKLGAGCFGNCPNLKEIKIFGEIDDIDKAPFFKSGNGGEITVYLSPTYAADSNFVARLTADMNTSNVKINSEPLGKVTISSFDRKASFVTVKFTVSDLNPWGVVNMKTVRLFYSNDVGDVKNFVGTGKFLYPSTLTGPDGEGAYEAKFPAGGDVPATQAFFCLTVGAERE